MVMRGREYAILGVALAVFGAVRGLGMVKYGIAVHLTTTLWLELGGGGDFAAQVVMGWWRLEDNGWISFSAEFSG